jgi:two-component system, chemotaxis family, CheB/CheR fusion protein
VRRLTAGRRLGGICRPVARRFAATRLPAERLVESLRNRPQVHLAPDEDGEEESLRRILTNVRVRPGHDFSQYKRATLLRIARRAQISQKETLVEYYAYVRQNAEEEAQALFADFLISVTTFFRDPKAFAALH